MAGLAGLRGTGDFSSDERPKNFREMILHLRPNGAAPIFALTSKAKKRTVTDPEYAWWTEPDVNVRLQVNKAGNHTSTDTTIIVDSADPSSSDQSLNRGTATNLKPGDMLMVEPSTDAASFSPEVIEVTGAISDTQFTCRRGAQGTAAATIADNAYLLLIGSGYAEGGTAPRAVSRNPIKSFNYTQIFKDSYEITATVNVTKTRTGDPWSNDKARKAFDHSRAIEWSFLFGQRSETTSSPENGKPIRTMGGIRSQIPSSRTTVFSGPATFTGATNNFLDAVYKVFDFESPAGDTRMAFCGNGALNALNKLVALEDNVRVNFDRTIQQYGMSFREFVMPQGRLLLKTHPLLNIHGGIYANSVWILDFSCVQYVTLPGRDTKPRDDVQHKDEDVRRGFYQTECSVSLDRAGLTCAYLGNVVAS
jgi:hypothetical protein